MDAKVRAKPVRGPRRKDAPATSSRSRSRTKPHAVASYLNVFRIEPLGRISIVKRGVPATAVGAIARDLGVPTTRLYRWLGLKASTTKRKEQFGERLSVADSEAVLGMCRLVGQVQSLVAGSAPADFDAAHWVGRWVEKPSPALGGKPPAGFLDTREGQDLVSRLLSQSAFGVYG
jgi:putative toxin-antitoxin system antitoxin component (TIGR02293 family)